MKYQLRIFHPEHGELTTPKFQDNVQFRIFCKMVQGALALKQDLTTYDAQDLFVHIPNKVLSECVIVSMVQEPMMTLAEYAVKKTETLTNN